MSEVEKIEASKQYGRKRGTDGYSVSLEYFLEFHVASLPEEYFLKRIVVVVVAQYRGWALSFLPRNLGEFDTSLEYYLQVIGETNWDFVDLIAADKLMNHTVLTTSFIELHEAFCRDTSAVPWPMMDVAASAFGRLSDFIAGAIVSTGTFRRDADATSLQRWNKRFPAQLNSVRSWWHTGRLLMLQRAIEITDLLALLAKSKNVLEPLECHTSVIKRGKSLVTFEQDTLNEESGLSVGPFETVPRVIFSFLKASQWQGTMPEGSFWYGHESGWSCNENFLSRPASLQERRSWSAYHSYERFFKEHASTMIECLFKF